MIRETSDSHFATFAIHLTVLPHAAARAALDETAWLDLAMTPANDGAFPVSHDFGWHGGRHLVVPVDDHNVGLPVRAIADGVVVYVRPRSNAESPDEPLNYGTGYTSDAVVVVKHTTDIGLTAQGQPLTVSFYSVYMHLHSVRPTVMRNRAIYRKDEIGQAGHIYGEPNRLHFEICCDDANLALLVGRTSGDLSTKQDGRADVLFGEMYCALPPATPVYGQHPVPNHARASVPPTMPRATKADTHPVTPAAQALAPVYMTTEELIVGVHYAGGNGAVGQRGDAVVTTYHPGGQIEGTPQRESEAEYKLYDACRHISESYPAASRPTPSAVYELLRFGRVIGPDALEPADVPHWRQVSYPGGVGWVNLNADNVHHFSDADFPPWRGWILADDDSTATSHCDSAKIAAIVYDHGDTCLERSKEHAIRQLSNSSVHKRLTRTICKFPSEWDVSSIDARWSWLKTASAEHPEPLSDGDYAQLKAHISALCFPLPELFKAQWCFEPKEFIKLFRTCGWLAVNEFAQCSPRRHLRLEKTTFRSSTVAWATALQAATLWITPFNQSARRYGVSNTRQRLVHYFSHVIPETGFLHQVKEADNKTGTYLRGKSYWPYYGRGLIQLTWLDNYQKYGSFRNFAHTIQTGTYAKLG